MKAPSPLSDDLLALLEAERELDVPTPAKRQRMLARLAPFIVPPGVGGGPTTGGPSGGSPGGSPSGGAVAQAAGAGASTLARGAWRAKVLLALASAAVGASGGAATHAYVVSHRPSTAALEGRENAIAADATSTAQSAAPATSAPTEAAALTDPPEPAQGPGALGSAAAPSSASRADDRLRGAASLRAERLLLEAATAALMRGDNASAIASLKKHAQSFPKGELAQEREALLVQALAASGDDAAAQRRAKEFKQKFPGSMQQGSVDKASRSE